MWLSYPLLLIAGLVIGIIAIMISFSQIFFVGSFARHPDRWPKDIQSAIENMKSDVTKEFKNGRASIKIESNGEKVEINVGTDKEDKVKQLENLESGKKETNDTLKKEK